jgi:RNA ligase (TIGR02306 family)
MGSEIKRKLASIQRISNVEDIEGADFLQLYTVLGWKVVDKKGAHKVGDLVVYISIDSWVPHDLAPFLSKGNEPQEYNGVKGERLRTIRLRGQISQGLILAVGERDYINYVMKPGGHIITVHEGDDLTDILGIQKWEAPIPAQLQGQARGTFPTSLIPKTDQERVQNIFAYIAKRDPEERFEVTTKLDGSSMTIFRWEGELRVASRNMELKINEENADNSFVRMAMQIGDKIPDGFAFQGELMGESIQGNREGFKGHKFFVFDVFNIREHAYLGAYARQKECEQRGLDHVPVIANDWKAPASVDEALQLAEGPSINHKIREGLVWKSLSDPRFSFKGISNKFLLKGGD